MIESRIKGSSAKGASDASPADRATRKTLASGVFGAIKPPAKSRKAEPPPPPHSSLP